MQKRPLPLGTENFKDLRKNNLYYVDKTGLIKELINEHSMVTLFTRPRRFGKTLNMSMLRYFFELGTDKSIFEGLAISKEKALCEKHMGQYPVISISLKGVEGSNYVSARESMWNVIRATALSLSTLENSTKLNSTEKELFHNLQKTNGNLEDSLRVLSQLLYKHYGKKVVVLIDEYDVPLDKSYYYGYYNEMILLIRQMFGAVLKTNDYLHLAVLTGCLRVSKESIFTGLNNLITHSIADIGFDEWFGFTDTEVQDLLNYYHLGHGTMSRKSTN